MEFENRFETTDRLRIFFEAEYILKCITKNTSQYLRKTIKSLAFSFQCTLYLVCEARLPQNTQINPENTTTIIYMYLVCEA